MKLIYKFLALTMLLISLVFLISCSKDEKTLEFEEASTFSEGVAMVKIDGLYGYVDKNFNVVIPTIYEDGDSFHDGKAKVEKDGYSGIINKNNEVLLPFEYDEIIDYLNKNIFVRKDGKWGILDESYNVICPFQFDQLLSPNGDYVAMLKDFKCGYIDLDGNVVVDFNYSSIYHEYFKVNGNETPIFITQDGMRFGYIYPEKNISVEPTYDTIYPSPFHEILIIGKDDKFGFIDLANNVTIAPKYDSSFQFEKEGIALVCENGIYNLIDTNGKELIQNSSYTNAVPSLSEGLIPLRNDKGYCYINYSGEVTIPGPFTSAESFNAGLAIVMSGYQYGIINTKGEYICEPIYRAIATNHYDENNKPIITASYSEETKFNTACYSYDGNLLFDTPYDTIQFYSYLNNDIGIVYDGGKYGCINNRGIEVIPVKYTKLSPIYSSKNLFIVQNSDYKYGIIDTLGQEILPFSYDKIEESLGDLLTIKANNKYGFYNIKTHTLVEPTYDEICSYDEENVIVRNGQKYIYLNSDGVPLT
ncbi:MAG: WG repeat-containing protein [Clostridium sp.]|nr:WG repeat-containing protein [Clostridium sp.]MDU7082462.1 WG repeat-containing protein [Clostridium sp.]